MLLNLFRFSGIIYLLKNLYVWSAPLVHLQAGTNQSGHSQALGQCHDHAESSDGDLVCVGFDQSSYAVSIARYRESALAYIYHIAYTSASLVTVTGSMCHAVSIDCCSSSCSGSSCVNVHACESCESTQHASWQSCC